MNQEKYENLIKKLERLQEQFNALGGRLGHAESEIRRNGVMADVNKEAIERLQEGHAMLYDKADRLENNLLELQELTLDYPALRGIVSRHSLQIQNLEKR